MDETVPRFITDIPLVPTLSLIESGFPVGLRPDLTVSQWRNLVVRDDDEPQIALALYEDGYGNTMVVLCEGLGSSTRVTLAITPQKANSDMAILTARVSTILQSHMAPPGTTSLNAGTGQN